MEIDFEVLILLITALMFMVAYLLGEEFKSKLIFGSLDIICWFALSLVYVASGSTFPILAWIFLAVGIVFSVLVIVGSVDMLKQRDKVWR